MKVGVAFGRKTICKLCSTKTALSSTAIPQAQRGVMIPPQSGVPFFMSLHEPVAISCYGQHPQKGADLSEATGDYR